MKKHVTFGLCIIILLIVLPTLLAEPVHVQIKDTDSPREFTNQVVSGSLSVTLPEKNLTLIVTNQGENFSLETTFTASNTTAFNITPRPTNLSWIVNTSEGIGSSLRYKPRLAYAIDVNASVVSPYIITFNYTDVEGDINDEGRLRVYQFNFNTTDNTSDLIVQQLYTVGTLLSGGSLVVNTTANTAKLQTTQLSLFVLAEDTQTASGSSSGGGGGGGGGSSSRSSSSVSITLTPEGVTASLGANSIVTLISSAGVYDYRVLNPSTSSVMLRSLGSQPTIYAVGFDQEIDLNADGIKDVVVRLENADANSAQIFFASAVPQKRPLSGFTVPAPKPKEEQEPTTQTQPPAVVVPPKEEPDNEPATQEEFNILWVILPTIAILLLVVVAVITFARRKTTSIEQPITPQQEIKQPLVIPRERKLEMEKFIYHGLHQGHSKEIIKQALLQKGWPEDEVDQVLEAIDFTDEHIEKEKLHKHTNVDYALPSVQRLLAKGFDEEHIRQALRRKGWQEKDIDELFRKL
ncbi:hypothetical protein D6774_00960 [Candidatus Woesearchaeota archaeon]|nr:MAG: hypothetical protein D6774_00960 [Candidatus Woesearchaeota archaeon]